MPTIPLSPYPVTQIAALITHRCNVSCIACETLCNQDATTGVESSDGDMTPADFELAIAQMERMSVKLSSPLLAHTFTLAGGESTLHPHVEAFCELAIARLKRPGIVGRVIVLTNGTNPTHPTRAHQENWTPLCDKPGIHTAYLSDPAAGREPMTYERCRNHRRDHINVTRWGWNLCCGSTGLIRMLCENDALLPELPTDFGAWNLAAMNRVCAACAFGNGGELATKVGATLAPRFEREAGLNHAGRRLVARIGGAR